MDEAQGSWVESKREYERGELVKVTTEFKPKNNLSWLVRKKDMIDIFFRTTGLVAIAIPIWLFFNQQSAEAKKQRAMAQLTIYTEASMRLHTLIRDSFPSKKFELHQQEFLEQLAPKLLLISDKNVIRYFEVVRGMIAKSTDFVEANRLSNDYIRLDDDMKEEYGGDEKFNLLVDSFNAVQIKAKTKAHMYTSRLAKVIWKERNLLESQDSSITSNYKFFKTWDSARQVFSVSFEHGNAQISRRVAPYQINFRKILSAKRFANNAFILFGEEFPPAVESLDSIMIISNRVLYGN